MSSLSTLESLLFVATKPISAKKISLLLSITLDEVEKLLEALGAIYMGVDRGLEIVRKDDKVSLVTKPEHSLIVQEYLKEEILGELSRPALETLAVIAYRGPVPKSEIEHIRGVHCGQSLRNLLVRGLIEEKATGSLDESHYAVSFEFMNHLGIQNIADLPNYRDLQNLLLQDIGATPRGQEGDGFSETGS